MERKHEVLSRNFSPYFSSQYQTCLWNPMAVGETLVLGNRHDRIVAVKCSERCLRLAHKHLIQDDENQYHGFLLGSMEISDDGTNVLISLDRFDPGIIKQSSTKLPSAILPNDIIVPILMTKNNDTAKTKFRPNRRESYFNAFKMLHEAVNSRSAIDVSRIFAMTLYCVYENKNANENILADLQLFWDMVFVSNLLEVTPVKSVPIIPTALAKTLASSMDLMQDETIKTGFMTMDQTRKLLLLLDSDPKVSQVVTVGIWISYIANIYHPAVWLACLRYLSGSPCYKRVLSEEKDFLLLVYSVPNSRPCFYKCSTVNFDRLNYDMVMSEHTVPLGKRHDQSHKTVNVTLDYSPPDESRLRDEFETVLQSHLKHIEDQCSINDCFCSNYQEDSCHASVVAEKTRNLPTLVSSTRTNYEDEGKCVSEPEPTPSPSPQPVNASAPTPAIPSVMEPSLIFGESVKKQPSLQNFRTSQPPARSPMQIRPQIFSSDDPLAPSLYEGNFWKGSYNPKSNEFQRNSVFQHAPKDMRRQHGPKDIIQTSSRGNLREQRANSPRIPEHTERSSSATPPHNALLHQDLSEYRHISQSEDSLHNPIHSLPRPPSSAASPLLQPPRSRMPQVQTTLSVKLQTQLWFRQLPNEACQFFAEQDQLIQNLSKKVEKLEVAQVSIIKKENVVHRETQTDIEKAKLDVEQRSVGTNTDSELGNETSDFLPHEANVLEARALNLTMESERACPVEEKVVNTESESLDQRTVSSQKSESKRCAVSEATVDGSQGWGSSCFQLDASVLNGTSNDQSITSSLRAVDLPGLDSSEENNQTPRGHAGWNQESPVLGESASMYMAMRPAPPMNIMKSYERPQTNSGGDEDKQFFNNLLKQVQEMLEKGDREVQPASTLLSPSSTNKQISSLKYTRDLSGSILPHLAYLGVLANTGMLESRDLSTLVGSGSGHELSIHANAIAMKYLSDDQLASIATATSDDHIAQILPATPKLETKQTLLDGRYSGMSLLSPCDMSLATKKYMKKYGLVDFDEDNLEPLEESDKENDTSVKSEEALHTKKTNKEHIEVEDKPRESDSVQGSFGCEERVKSSSVCSRRSDRSKHSCNSEPGRKEKTGSAHWSQLQNNLGETFDMLHPFLNDLERKQQSDPPQGDSREEHYSQLDRTCPYAGIKCAQAKFSSKEADSGVGETIEQILSPRILESLNKANQKLKMFTKELDENHRGDSAHRKDLPSSDDKPTAGPSNRDVVRNPCDDDADVRLMPPPQGHLKKRNKCSAAARSGSVDRILRTRNVHEKNRRMSSSPTDVRRFFPKRPWKTKTEKESYERVLDSQVMQAFNRDAITLCSEGSPCHEEPISESFEDTGNILNLKKIKQLRKLS